MESADPADANVVLAVKPVDVRSERPDGERDCVQAMLYFRVRLRRPGRAQAAVDRRLLPAVRGERVRLPARGRGDDVCAWEPLPSETAGGTS